MTTLPLHRADARSFKRYKSTSNIRRRHHAGVIAPVQRTKTSTVFFLIMAGTLISCWALIYGLLLGMQVNIVPAPALSQPSMIDQVMTPAVKFGGLSQLDPSILAGLDTAFQFPSGSH